MPKNISEWTHFGTYYIGLVTGDPADAVQVYRHGRQWLVCNPRVPAKSHADAAYDTHGAAMEAAREIVEDWL